MGLVRAPSRMPVPNSFPLGDMMGTEEQDVPAGPETRVKWPQMSGGKARGGGELDMS